MYALYFAYRHPRTPWYAKCFVILVAAYALSPIDLVPDFIPVLGYLDDMVIVPAGAYLALKMVPRDVLEECRQKARSGAFPGGVKWAGLGIVLTLWAIVAALVARVIWSIVTK